MENILLKPIRIFGGGLAGLSLGILLREKGVPVTVTEALRYPRHRVCGEFISGSGQTVLQTLGLETAVSAAAINRSTAWFDRDRPVLESDLPTPSLGISRFALDAQLADRFTALGGKLATGRFVRSFPETEGTVLACGRRAAAKNWIALKLHCRGLAQTHDLAMHLGTGGYVGVSRIEDERWNVCGLFRIRREISPGKTEIIPAYLRANQLHKLADSVAASEIDFASITATANLRFGSSPWPNGVVCIGDSATAIPPFAGNGMSMAFESAQTAFPVLLAYATGEKPWPDARQELQRKLRHRFRTRIRAAQTLHPLLLQPRLRPLVSVLLSQNILPFQLLFRLLR